MAYVLSNLSDKGLSELAIAVMAERQKRTQKKFAGTDRERYAKQLMAAGVSYRRAIEALRIVYPELSLTEAFGLVTAKE